MVLREYGLMVKLNRQHGIKGILFNGELELSTWYPPGSYQHPTRRCNANFGGRITNHNQNITADAANNSNINTTVRFDGMVSCCNLHRERN